tara:strand:- start:294 stop:620 length:327 start_codon:yes stop_codon:yes gene_type:complete
MPIGQRSSPTRKSPTKGKPKKLIPTNGSASGSGQYGAVGFKPSSFTPSSASKANQSRNENVRDLREYGSSFGNSAKVLNTGRDNSKMVQIEVEQGVPDDIKSYYSSNS